MVHERIRKCVAYVIGTERNVKRDVTHTKRVILTFLRIGTNPIAVTFLPAVHTLLTIFVSFFHVTLICRNASHPYLKQWAKEIAHKNKNELQAYILSALKPISSSSQGQGRECYKAGDCVLSPPDQASSQDNQTCLCEDPTHTPQKGSSEPSTHPPQKGSSEPSTHPPQKGSSEPSIVSSPPADIVHCAIQDTSIADSSTIRGGATAVKDEPCIDGSLLPGDVHKPSVSKPFFVQSIGTHTLNSTKPISRLVMASPLSGTQTFNGTLTSSYGSAAVPQTTLSVCSTAAVPSKPQGIAELVTLNEFADAFLKGDVTNWYQRMALLDHIEAVQKKMAAWMDEVEKQLDGKGVLVIDGY